MKRSKVLLIDSNPTSEHKNEGKLIREFLKIIKGKSDYEKAKSKKELSELLGKRKQGIIHISAHGKKESVCVGRRKLKIHDILEVDEKRRADGLRKVRLIICSACHGGLRLWQMLSQNRFVSSFLVQNAQLTG